jgi:hypothetical protein
MTTTKKTIQSVISGYAFRVPADTPEQIACSACSSSAHLDGTAGRDLVFVCFSCRTEHIESHASAALAGKSFSARGW